MDQQIYASFGLVNQIYKGPTNLCIIWMSESTIANEEFGEDWNKLVCMQYYFDQLNCTDFS